MSTSKSKALNFGKLLKCRLCKVVRYDVCVRRNIINNKWICANCAVIDITFPSWGGEFNHVALRDTCTIDNTVAALLLYCVQVDGKILRFIFYID